MKFYKAKESPNTTLKPSKRRTWRQKRPKTEKVCNNHRSLNLSHSNSRKNTRKRTNLKWDVSPDLNPSCSSPPSMKDPEKSPKEFFKEPPMTDFTRSPSMSIIRTGTWRWRIDMRRSTRRRLSRMQYCISIWITGRDCFRGQELDKILHIERQGKQSEFVRRRNKRSTPSSPKLTKSHSISNALTKILSKTN